MLTLYYGIACVSWKSLPVILFNTMASTCLSYRLFSLSMSHKPVLTMRSRTLLLSHFSRVWLFETLWTVACQAPLYMGILQAEYWSGLPCPPPGDLPNLEMEPTSLMSPELAGMYFTTSATWEALIQDTAAAAKSLQSCLTLCNPRDSSPPGSPVPGIPQARTLEWVAISFSNAWKWKWSRSIVSDS